MSWQNFSGLTIHQNIPQNIKRRYSVTADILAYDQCPTQYGAFKVRKYEPALAVQLFYGTIIHQVLDRAHGHFRGTFNSATRGTIATDTDIERYFTEVENSLKARSIRAVTQVRDQALEVLKRFNNLEGSTLYPLITDTECKLQADQGNYILHGNVDVITNTQNGIEIWDYKGCKKPSPGSPVYNQYVYQMCVYAELYRKRTGRLPDRAVLYFLNELAGGNVPTTRPVDALIEVGFNSTNISVAINNFGNTVQNIERCRSTKIWPNPIHPPTDETCVACDLRWKCSYAISIGRVYQMMYP